MNGTIRRLKTFPYFQKNGPVLEVTDHAAAYLRTTGARLIIPVRIIYFFVVGLVLTDGEFISFCLLLSSVYVVICIYSTSVVKKRSSNGRRRILLGSIKNDTFISLIIVSVKLFVCAFSSCVHSTRVQTPAPFSV